MLRAIVRPRPLPPCASRVVKKGANTWGRSSAGMPPPLSCTVMRTASSPDGHTRTEIVPSPVRVKPCTMAFSINWLSTWQIEPG